MPTFLEWLFIPRVDPDGPGRDAQVFCTAIISLLSGDIIYGLWAIVFLCCLFFRPSLGCSCYGVFGKSVGGLCCCQFTFGWLIGGRMDFCLDVSEGGESLYAAWSRGPLAFKAKGWKTVTVPLAPLNFIWCSKLNNVWIRMLKSTNYVD